MFLLSAESGSVDTVTIMNGDDTKPISLYAYGHKENPVVSSSAGLKINTGSSSVTANLSLDNTGISVSSRVNDNEIAVSVYVDLSRLKIGFKVSNTVYLSDGISHTNYVKIEVDILDALIVGRYISGVGLIARVDKKIRVFA